MQEREPFVAHATDPMPAREAEKGRCLHICASLEDCKRMVKTLIILVLFVGIPSKSNELYDVNKM